MDEQKEKEIELEKEEIVEVLPEEKNDRKNQKSNKENTKKKNHTTTMMTVGVLAVICFVAILAYYFIWNNPKNIFLNAVNNEYQTISNKLSKFTNGNKKYALDDVITTTTKVSFNMKASEQLQDPSLTTLLTELSKVNMTLNTGMDRKKKELSTEVLLNSENDPLFHMNVYGTKKKMYVELKDLLNKFIEFPLEEEYDQLFNNQQTSIEDLDYMMNAIKDSFLKNLDKKDFKQTKETIKIDGKDVKATKTSYQLTNKNARVLMQKMIKDLKENKKFLEKYASLTGMSKTDVRDQMEEVLEDVKNSDTQSKDVLTLSIYTKGMMNEALAYEAMMKTEDGEHALHYTKGKTSMLLLTEDQQEVLTLMVEKESSDQTVITLTADTIKMTIHNESKNDINTYVYTLTEDSSDVKLYGTLTVDSKEVTKNKKYQEDMKFEMFMDASGIKKAFTMNADILGTTEIGKDLKIPEIKSATTLDQLTEQDMTTIMTNLSKNEKLMNFVNTLSSLF